MKRNEIGDIVIICIQGNQLYSYLKKKKKKGVNYELEYVYICLKSV